MSNSYDPFRRGTNPVGVRSDVWTDALRDRALPVEIWYPAAPVHTGQDLDPSQQDAYPAIVYPMAALASGKHAGTAVFLNYLKSTGARAIFEKHGFSMDR